MAARAKSLLLLLTALCLPAFAHVPHASLLVPKPHQGVERLAQASHRGFSASNALNATGLSACLCDEGVRSRSTGKERGEESKLDYFLARYYSGALGRFTSTDPLNIPALQGIDLDRFAGVIGDPRNWNQYGYAHNSPLSKVDPDGYLTVIVPGTNNDQVEDWTEDSRFKREVEKTFGEDAVILNNPGMGNSKEARSAAAKALVELVSNHQFAEGESLNIVAHSHGGNVVFQATKSGLDHKIDNLVTLGTPIRTDYRPDYGKIGTFLNVYSRQDNVQTSGGQWFVAGSADRQLRSPHVTNVDATSTASGHSELWRNTKVWTTIVAPKLKK